MWMSHNIDRWFTKWMGGGVFFRVKHIPFCMSCGFGVHIKNFRIFYICSHHHLPPENINIFNDVPTMTRGMKVMNAKSWKKINPISISLPCSLNITQ
jgi:hypothetical protein